MSTTVTTTSKQTCFLICNAHLDPVWLWPWEDGMVEAISTFRVAADFCEAHPQFVFNHNESLLYEWVEEHDPELFARIQKFVQLGRWHIAGGSYLQPDPVGAGGESMIRHYLVGKQYFSDKFNVEPTTAYNFDSFGHPRGMIQVLAGCGFDSYIFCRPNPQQQKLPIGSFCWQHASGAQIFARRSDDHYITQGEIHRNMSDGNWPRYYANEGDFMFLWGIGNHGGGPSRDEYAQFPAMRAEFPHVNFVESTPEAFFKRSLAQRSLEQLPVHQGDLQPVHEGCYVSMLRVKQAHRRLENLIAVTERLVTLAWWRLGVAYPERDMLDAWKDVLFCEFHDILPGSGIPTVEADALARLGHAEENLRRLKSRAMIQLLRDEPLAERNRTPIFVFNPHAWPVTQEVEFEYCIDRQFAPDQVVRSLSCDGHPVVTQFEKGEHNLLNPGWGEWRQKAVFLTTVPPLSFKRFDADYTVLPKEKIVPWTTPAFSSKSQHVIDAGAMQVTIDLTTGLLASVRVEGMDVLRARSAQPVVFADKAHAWETFPQWTDPVARFTLATPQEAARIRGSARTNPQFEQGQPPIAIIEDGPVRQIVEAIFVWQQSFIVQRYVVSKVQPIVHIEQDILWVGNELMLSLELQHDARLTRLHAERCYSVDDVTQVGDERGSMQDVQHFLRVSDQADQHALGVISYGPGGYSDRAGVLRLHVLRGVPYSGMDDMPATCDRFHNRFIPRQDQGVRSYRVTLVLGALSRTQQVMTRTAWEHHQPLSPMVYFPTRRDAQKKAQASLVQVSQSNVLVVAMKKADRGDELVVRFWEVAGRDTAFEAVIDERAHRLNIGKHQLLTVRVSRDGTLTPTDLLERPRATLH